jgi:hypothetical protein
MLGELMFSRLCTHSKIAETITQAFFEEVKSEKEDVVAMVIDNLQTY